MLEPNPRCRKGNEQCTMPVIEKCIDGYCVCIEGMRRSRITKQCEWLLDIACHKVSVPLVFESIVALY